MSVVDLVIVGGGLQGLVLLREFSAAGYSCVLVTNDRLGSGQTLHSHGLLNSGTGLLTGVLRDELHTVTLPYLRRLNIPIHDQHGSFLLLPEEVVGQLAPAWQAHRYHPERIDSSELPAGVEPAAAVYRVRGFNVDKRRLVEALSAGLEPLILAGELVEATSEIRVRETASGNVVVLEPRAVVVAAGCGTKRLLRDVFAVQDVALARISYTKPHMICLRGPAHVLPELGTLLSPELIIVRRAHAPFTSRQGLVTWYVTPAHPSPTRYLDAPDNAAAEVEPDVVRSGVEALVRLLRPLNHHDQRIEATVFAGYKQDFDGEPTRRACELVDEERNVLMVLPSVLANAVPNALEALTKLRQRLAAPPRDRLVPSSGTAAIGELNEHANQTRWSGWGEFGDAYGVQIS